MRKWANRSFFSAYRSFALSLTKNEWFTQKMLTKIIFLKRFVHFKKTGRFAHSLFINERCEQIAQVAQQKWAIWGNHSGPSPKTSDYERFAQVHHQKWANCSFFWANWSFTHYSLIFSQKEWLAQKTDERIPHAVLLTPKPTFGETFMNNLKKLFRQKWVNSYI